MMTTVSLIIIYPYTKIYNNYLLFPHCSFHTHDIYFVIEVYTSYFSHLFLSSLLPTPLWQPPVCFLYLWLVLVCRIYIHYHLFLHKAKRNKTNRFFFYLYEGPEVVMPVWCFHSLFHQPSFNYSVTDHWNPGCLAEFMRMKKM